MRRADDADALGAVVGDVALVRAAFEQMPMIIMSQADGDYRVTAVNAACQDLIGRTDVVGRPVADLLPGLLTGQQIRALLDRVYTTGQAETGRAWQLGVSPNLAEPPAPAYLDFAVRPVLSSGLVTGLVAAGIDVTANVLARREAEQEADDAEKRYLTARDVIAEFQEALLPTALPVLPQARISARYLVAGHERAAGGDWFDAIALPDGTVVLAVGDVVGHGMTAAAAMAQLRAVMNELLSSGADLLTAVSRMDAFAARTPALRAATLAAATLNAASGDVCYVTCGHPPLLLVAPGGKARYLPLTPGGPLGTGDSREPAIATLPPGGTLLLYSDGLVERPGRTLQAGLAELAQVAGDSLAGRIGQADANLVPAERVCQQTVELLTRGGHADDVTVLAAERLPEPVMPVHLRLPAEPGTLRVIRRALRSWLSGLDALPDDQDGVHIAVVEMVTNAIEHAYPPGRPGAVEFDSAIRPDGQLECLITDYGTWRAPDPAADHRGNGLMVAEHMVDVLQVSHPAAALGAGSGAPSTVVRLLHRIRRPAFLASDAGPTVYADNVSPPFAVLVDEDGRLARARVLGIVDVATADEFERRLLSACRGGTVPLRLDLSGTEQLASAGVSALYHLSRQLARHGNRLDLITRDGGSVRAVLEVVGLAHSGAADGEAD